MSTINAQTIEQVKNLTEELFQKMGVDVEVRAKIVTDDIETGESLVINIESSDASMLIGQGGRNIVALQHVIRMMLRKKQSEFIRLSVDVDGYREDKLQLLKNVAQNAARKATEQSERVILRPMPAYERRLVHKFLGEDGSVETESIGQDETRRVVVKPKRDF